MGTMQRPGIHRIMLFDKPDMRPSVASLTAPDLPQVCIITCDRKFSPGNYARKEMLFVSAPAGDTPVRDRARSDPAESSEWLYSVQVGSFPISDLTAAGRQFMLLSEKLGRKLGADVRIEQFREEVSCPGRPVFFCRNGPKSSQKDQSVVPWCRPYESKD